MQIEFADTRDYMYEGKSAETFSIYLCIVEITNRKIVDPSIQSVTRRRSALLSEHRVSKYFSSRRSCPSTSRLRKSSATACVP